MIESFLILVFNFYFPIDVFFYPIATLILLEAATDLVDHRLTSPLLASFGTQSPQERLIQIGSVV